MADDSWLLPVLLRRRGRVSCPDELAALLRGRAGALSRRADEPEPEELREELRPVEEPRPDAELRPDEELRPVELPRPDELRSEEELRGLRVPSPSAVRSA